MESRVFQHGGIFRSLTAFGILLVLVLAVFLSVSGDEASAA